MIRFFAACVSILTATSVFAKDAVVELSLSGVAYTQTSTKIEPDGSDAEKTTESDFVTSPFAIEFAVQLDKSILHYSPDVANGGAYGMVRFGYMFAESLEGGVLVSLQDRKTKTAGDIDPEDKNTTLGLYATYSLPIAGSHSLELEPVVALANGEAVESVEVNGADVEETSKHTGMAYGLSVTLVNEIAQNYFGEISASYGIYDLDLERRVASAEKEEAAYDQTIFDLTAGFRVRI